MVLCECCKTAILVKIDFRFFFVAVGIYNGLILNPMLNFMGIDLVIEDMRNSLFWKLFSADYLVLYQKSVEVVVKKY